MKRKRFNEAQTIAVLKEGESGINCEELSRKHGIATTHRIAKSSLEFSGFSAAMIAQPLEARSEFSIDTPHPLGLLHAAAR